MHEGKSIEKLIKLDDRTAIQIAELIGVSRNQLYNIYKEEVVSDYYKKKFGEIGIVITDAQNSTKIKPNAEYAAYDIMEIPLVQEEAYAGYSQGFKDKEFIESLPTITVRKLTDGNYKAFQIKGDSMESNDSHSINDGDVLLAKELPKHLWKYKFHLGKVFMIVTDDGIQCKKIISHDINDGIITCHSNNPKFKDFKLHLKDVKELYYAKKIIERNLG